MKRKPGLEIIWRIVNWLIGCCLTSSEHYFSHIQDGNNICKNGSNIVRGRNIPKDFKKWYIILYFNIGELETLVTYSSD
jgi:hypothetical protein